MPMPVGDDERKAQYREFCTDYNTVFFGRGWGDEGLVTRLQKKKNPSS